MSWSRAILDVSSKGIDFDRSSTPNTPILYLLTIEEHLVVLANILGSRTNWISGGFLSSQNIFAAHVASQRGMHEEAAFQSPAFYFP